MLHASTVSAQQTRIQVSRFYFHNRSHTCGEYTPNHQSPSSLIALSLFKHFLVENCKEHCYRPICCPLLQGMEKRWFLHLKNWLVHIENCE